MTHCILGFPSQSGSNPQRLRGTQWISVKRWPTSGTQSQGPPQECREGGPPAPTPCLLLSVLTRMGNSLGFPSHSSLCLPASTYKKKKKTTTNKKTNKTPNAGTPKGLKKCSGGCSGQKPPQELLPESCNSAPTRGHREDRQEQPRDPALPASRHSPTGFVFLAADAAAAEQREQEDEQQRQEGSGPDHPHPLVGLCKTEQAQLGAAGGPATRTQRHSPMWQAPVSGSHVPSWQLQASAQLAP